MKTKKGIFFTVLAFALVATVAVSAGGDKENWVKLKAELNLTDAQVTQLQQKFEAIKPQGQEHELKVKALKSEIASLEKAASPDKQAIDLKKAELMSAKTAWKEKSNEIYRSVLSSDQFAKLQQMHAKEKKAYSEKKKY
jgi:chromosome segregation ATPase